MRFSRFRCENEVCRRHGLPGSGLVLILVLLVLIPVAPVFAQPEGWVKVKRESQKPVVLHQEGSPRMAGMEIGFPGVFAPRVHFPVSGRHGIGIGPILLPGLTGAVGEYRYHLTPPRREKFSLYAGSALAVYDIRSEDRSVGTLGFFFSVGTLYITRSSFALGGALGVLNTTGSAGEKPVKSFGVRKGMSSAAVNFSVSYVF